MRVSGVTAPDHQAHNQNIVMGGTPVRWMGTEDDGSPEMTEGPVGRGMACNPHWYLGNI